MPHPSFRLKLVPLAVASVLAAASLQAGATPMTYGPITLDAVYALGSSNPSNAVDGMSEASIASNGNGADLYLSRSQSQFYPYGSSVFFHTYGFSDSLSYFGARASGEGSFYGKTSASLKLTFTNTSSMAQLFNFAFSVSDGEVGLTGAGTGFAELMLNVRKNGTTVAERSTRIDQTAGGTTCSDTGAGGPLAAYMGCTTASDASVSESGGLFNVSFGEVAAGESFTLDYDIIATVSGNLSQGTQEHWVCGYGGLETPQLAAAATEQDGYGSQPPTANACSLELVSVPGSAISRSGDPFDPFGFSSLTFAGTFSDPNTVPEPGSLALVAAATAGLAVAGRRRQRQRNAGDDRQTT